MCTVHVDFQTEVDVIEDVDEYNTWAGGLVIVLRLLVVVCFLASLRDTMANEFNQERLQGRTDHS